MKFQLVLRKFILAEGEEVFELTETERGSGGFGSTDKDSVNQALAALKNVNTNLTGVVFNDLNNNNSYYSKNYYTYDQYYASS